MKRTPVEGEDEIWRGASLLANESPLGTRHYALDHLGSPRLVTDATGAMIGACLGTQDFSAFGEGGATGAGALQFTAHERDWSHGPNGWGETFDYMHARYYCPVFGRFLSVDPGRFDPSRPQWWNRYAYGGNNPINRTDPTGKCEQKEGEPPCSDLEITVTAKNPSEQEHYLFLMNDTKETDLPFMGDWGSAHLFPNELWWSYQTKQQEKLAGHPVTPGEGAVLLGMALAGGPESAANATRLSNQLTAEEIAAGHAFEKHVLQQGEFPWVASRSEFAAHIEKRE